jgi:hypothetical protein
MQIPVFYSGNKIGNVSEVDYGNHTMTIQLDEDKEEVGYIEYLIKTGSNVSMSSRFEFQNEPAEPCLAELKSIEIKKENQNV